MIKKSLTISLLICVSAYAVGYKIPEQSLRAVGTAGAYFSSADHPDASYYNPSNMVWIEQSMELGLRIVNTLNQTFKGNVVIPYIGPTDVEDETKSKNFYIPYFHYVSKDFKGYKFGLSIDTPAGLAKEWKGTLKTFAQKFELKTIEINSSVAKKISNNLSVAVGVRGVYSEGDVRYSHIAGAYFNKVKGNSFDFGWNASVSYRPVSNVNLSISYRSKVNMTLKGNAKGKIGPTNFDTGASISAPIPETWDFGVSFKVEKALIDLTYERMNWKSYDYLDFDYDNPLVEGVFGNKIEKKWKNTDSFRVGLRYNLNETWELMTGYGYNENPVPEKTMYFDLPDGNSNVFSLGAVYKKDRYEFGAAYLYASKKDRDVKSPPNINGINGKFENNKIRMVNISISYKF